ncbi:MAG: nuclear transport factor 2 family protein [Acidimicrobiales bacterium]
MYKAAVRKLVRHGIDRLNAGDPEFLLRLAAPDIELMFAGDNSWSSMHRPIQKRRTAFVTHRGADEARSFAERFVDEGIQVEIEDILVNGPPWHTRVAIRAHDYIAGPDGTDTYNNRFVDFLEIRWGRIVRFEVFEDTERVAVWDEQRRSLAG